jgi:methyl-accepting chemotaxis protein
MDATLPSLAAPAGRATPSRARLRDAFRIKLYGLVAVAAILLIALQTFSVFRGYQNAVEGKTAELRAVANSAVGILARYNDLATQGKMSRPDAQRLAFEAIRGIRFDNKEAYIFIWDTADATTLVHALPAQEGQFIFKMIADKRPKEVLIAERVNAMRGNQGEVVYRVMQARPGTTTPLPKQNISLLYEPWNLVVGTGVWLDRIDAEFKDDLIESVTISSIAALLLILGGVIIVRGVMRQLGGEPSGAVLVMRQAASGDFRGSDAGGKRKILPGSLLAAFGDMSGSIRSMITNVRDEAGSLKRDATRLSESVEQVLSASTHQSEATASMAAAIEELTVSVSHISEAAIETEKLSEDVASLCRSSEGQVGSASDGMDRIASAVGEASGKIAGLEARAEEINAIAASIKEIAAQTNLLALNAAIEAARAGEHGRGFSVVADEVRKLAERTASATIEIEQTVRAVQQETRDSTETMGRVGPIVTEGHALTQQVAQSLREIRSRADMTLERVREVANATREQSSASTSIAQRVEGIAQMVEQTTASMDETARSAKDMRDMSIRLDHLVGSFKV